ncbi:MAG: hypothetical protein K9K67_05565 [Bacteriovoracaceae bacterium]|nr:hypothetical protein [Bacteriovoracaceae bacterium]
MAIIEKNIKSIDPSRPFAQVEPKKQCPRCASVFVTKKECESCGYQFWIDLLGEPFGARSFFNIRDVFQHQYKWLYRFSFLGSVRKSSHVSRYKRSLIKRLEILCGYFFDEFDEDKERRKLFLFEAREIMNEVFLWGGSLSQMWLMLEKGERHPLFQNLSSQLSELEQSRSLKVPIKEKIKAFRIYGTIPFVFITKLFIGISAIVLAAFLVMKVLLNA